MRIIGGHDIYDGHAASWHDDLIWTRGNGKPDREQEKVLKSILATNPRQSYVLKGTRPRLIRSDSLQVGKDRYQIHYPIIFLCGKIYRGIRLTSVHEELFFWKEDVFNAWLESNMLQKRRAFSSDQNYPFTTTDLTSAQEQPFLDARIVVAWATNRMLDRTMYWQVNTAGLEHLDVGKLMPPAEIAQEIIAYVGRRMVEPDPATIQISDADRMVKHGMDKTSFRKPSGDKKRGKK